VMTKGCLLLHLMGWGGVEYICTCILCTRPTS
jgi:hypothetical protein